MDHSCRRIVDDDRLRGLWLRHASSESIDSAPVCLADGTLGLAHVEIRPEAGDDAHRTISWLLFARAGVQTSGEFASPAVAPWPALVAVERLLLMNDN
jgi:hypothetical protein